jgi:hypothetical protein
MANIALGQTINGSLTSDDSKYAGSGYPFDRYDFTGLDDYRQLTITVTREIGKSFEILLKDAVTGELVAAEIDDYGAGKLTLKATTFPGIKYQVEVNGGSDGFFGTVKGGDLGNYTLSTEDGGKATSIVTTNKVQLSRGITGTVSVGTVGTDGKFFALASGFGTLSDVALAPNGQFYGISSNANILERIDPSKYLGNQVDYANGIAALSTIKESTTGFQIGGTIDAIEFANNKLYALDRTSTGDKLYTIDTNPTSGITGGYLATLVGNLPTGFVTSGDDFVYDAANNRFLATAADTSTSDALWQIPLANPAGAIKIGQIGFTGLTGLDFENGQLTGISNKSDGTGTKIVINPTTGVGTLGQTISGLLNISGATTIVGTNVTNPTTPTTPAPTTPTPTTPTNFPTTPAGAIGTKSQGLAEGRIVDLTDYASKALKLDLATTGDAVYNNNIGFYAVQDTSGTIKLANGTTLKPGDANYALEAIKSAVLQAGKIDSKANLDVPGGGFYAPVVVAQGTLADFVAKNPTNGGGADAIHAYFNYLGANPDKIDHFRLTSPNTFAVEDLYGGGDKDFNDLIVNMNFKTA